MSNQRAAFICAECVDQIHRWELLSDWLLSLRRYTWFRMSSLSPPGRQPCTTNLQSPWTPHSSCLYLAGSGGRTPRRKKSLSPRKYRKFKIFAFAWLWAKFLLMWLWRMSDAWAGPVDVILIWIWIFKEIFLVLTQFTLHWLRQPHGRNKCICYM